LTNGVPREELPVLGFEDSAAFQAWLAGQHAASPGIWLKIPRKGSAVPGVSYPEALEVALCFGWIDGQKARLDDDYWLQRFTPRRPGSRWSKINTEKAAELIEAGRMRPAGLREVERARADGRWDAAYAGQRTMSVPPDLERALAGNDAARAFFAALSGVNRYAILYRIADAKRPATRARRIEKYVAMLAAHETIHPQA
jgi:uncharacterized protein YdeI (YjbR/CyaY-like superfamily)